ncbi:MAG: hypothetical protein FJ308_17445 [Planctomycetes bacterium]|nr:hypothetical protein [Planctomycetota bacterium]
MKNRCGFAMTKWWAFLAIAALFCFWLTPTSDAGIVSLQSSTTTIEAFDGHNDTKPNSNSYAIIEAGNAYSVSGQSDPISISSDPDDPDLVNFNFKQGADLQFSSPFLVSSQIWLRVTTQVVLDFSSAAQLQSGGWLSGPGDPYNADIQTGANSIAEAGVSGWFLDGFKISP